MQTDDRIFKVVEDEILARLTADPCETCGRGADAEKVAATALAKIWNDSARLQLAEQKAQIEERQEGSVNPLALVATVEKLPADHPKRGELLELLDGQLIALEAARDRLRTHGSVETVSP